MGIFVLCFIVSWLCILGFCGFCQDIIVFRFYCPLNSLIIAYQKANIFFLAIKRLSSIYLIAIVSLYILYVQVNHALLEEIREINERLIDTVVDISDEDADPSVPVSAALGSGGTIVRCCFGAITLSPNLKSQYTSAHMVSRLRPISNQDTEHYVLSALCYSVCLILQSPIQPLRLLIPANYPNCSPILLDKLPVDVR